VTLTFFKIKSFHAFLDKDWNPKTKILNMFFLLSAFIMWILYFCVKNHKKAPCQSEYFSLKIGQLGCQQNPEFRTAFRAEEIVLKNAPKKN
jgi:hypothetical protein